MFPSNTDFETNVTLENVKRETETSPLPEDMPFHILLLGDWSGNENHSKISDLSLLKPIEIDRDNFDDVLKKLKVKLNLDFNGKGNNYLSLSFNELEDFHPDRIFQQVSLFADLREVRQRLKNSDTFNDAAREVRSWLSGNKENDIADISETFSVEINNTSQNDLLDQILGQADETFSGTQYTNTKPTELNNLIKDLVHPYLINIDTTEQANLLMIVDEVISDLMRKILHHPEFQSLESAWRGAYFLIRRIEMDSQLKIYLLDVTKEELIVNLKEINSLQDSGFYKILTLDNKQSSDYKSWALVCANYTFSLNVDDVAALIRIAKIAANTNTPFISHINPEMFKINAIDNSENSNNWEFNTASAESKLWQMLRSAPEATHIGLAMPRFLVRLPYGEKTNPTETFSLEEFTEKISHEAYLWANPAFACGLLLAQTFREYGWDMSHKFFQDIESLPFHLYQDDNETKTKPCAEFLMTQRNCERIIEQGLIPLISFKNTDRVRIGQFQSIASPSTKLTGKWR